MPAAEVDSKPSSEDTGAVSFITTVRGSVAIIEAIGALGFLTPEKFAAFTAVLSKRFQLARMSSASTLRPLTGATWCQLAFGLILNVTCILSGLNSQDSMRSPMYSVPGGLFRPGLRRTRRENTIAVGTPELPSGMFGSKCVTSALRRI